MPGSLTTKDVADKYGVDTREVLYAARRELIKGIKLGWVWTFKEKDLPKKWPVRSRKKRVVGLGA